MKLLHLVAVVCVLVASSAHVEAGPCKSAQREKCNKCNQECKDTETMCIAVKGGNCVKNELACEAQCKITSCVC